MASRRKAGILRIVELSLPSSGCACVFGTIQPTERTITIKANWSEMIEIFGLPRIMVDGEGTKESSIGCRDKRIGLSKRKWITFRGSHSFLKFSFPVLIVNTQQKGVTSYSERKDDFSAKIDYSVRSVRSNLIPVSNFPPDCVYHV